MTKEKLRRLYEEHGNLGFEGHCNDCQKEIVVKVDNIEGELKISGGAVYEPDMSQYYLKCDKCFEQDKILRNFRDNEVYSRIVGYLRPIKQWNPAKQAEFEDRTLFKNKAFA